MATKKDNGNPGIDILLKRTDFVYNDTKIDTEGLKYGEPLFNKDDYTLTVGDGSETKVSEMKIFQAMDRDRAKLYDGLDTNKLKQLESADLNKFKWLESISQDNLNWLKNISLTNLNSIKNVWDNHFNSADAIGTVWLDAYTVDTSWYTFNPTTGEPTSQLAIAAPCAKKIHVNGIKDGTHPVLFCPIPLNEMSNAKVLIKSSSMVTSGEVKDGYIILYCANKVPQSYFYITLIGG